MSRHMKLTELFREADRDSLVIFLGSAALIALYMNCGSTAFAAKTLSVRPDDPKAVFWLYFSCLLCCGVGSIVLWRGILKRPLKGIGIGAGDLGFTLKMLGFCLPFIVLPAVWITASDPEIRAEYPLAVGLAGSTSLLLLYEACYLLYYVGWEVFYRGLLVLGLEKRIGPFAAVGVSTLVSTAIHYGKPQGEIWAAAIAGFLLGWLVLRTRSLIGPFVFHAAAGVMTDLFVLFQTGHLR
jgi:membrane protease YdiL (CAAX protease family)